MCTQTLYAPQQRPHRTRQPSSALHTSHLSHLCLSPASPLTSARGAHPHPRRACAGGSYSTSCTNITFNANAVFDGQPAQLLEAACSPANIMVALNYLTCVAGTDVINANGVLACVSTASSDGMPSGDWGKTCGALNNPSKGGGSGQPTLYAYCSGPNNGVRACAAAACLRPRACVCPAGWAAWHALASISHRCPTSLHSRIWHLHATASPLKTNPG